MNELRNPMNLMWYYVPLHDDYFPLIEYKPDGVLLDGTKNGWKPFIVKHEDCREAIYEEVREFYITHPDRS